MFFLQCFLILVIADLANVEEEFSPDIFSRSLKIVEFLNVVSLSFEIIDKSADKKIKILIIFEFLRIDQFLIDFFRWTFIQYIAAFDKLFL